jgi:hypothetical protein
LVNEALGVPLQEIEFKPISDEHVGAMRDAADRQKSLLGASMFRGLSESADYRTGSGRAEKLAAAGYLSKKQLSVLDQRQTVRVQLSLPDIPTPEKISQNDAMAMLLHHGTTAYVTSIVWSLAVCATRRQYRLIFRQLFSRLWLRLVLWLHGVELAAVVQGRCARRHALPLTA